MLETSSRTINGIDLDAVDALVDRVRTDARCGFAGFRVKTEWKGQVRSESTVEAFTCAGEPVDRNFTIVSDEPRELLGTDTGPNPQELLLSALNACMVVGYVSQASARGIRLDGVWIETDGELDLRGFFGIDEAVPPGYRRVNYSVRLDGDGTPAQYEEIHEAVMSASPNFFNLAQPIQMCGRLA